MRISQKGMGFLSSIDKNASSSVSTSVVEANNISRDIKTNCPVRFDCCY